MRREHRLAKDTRWGTKDRKEQKSTRLRRGDRTKKDRKAYKEKMRSGRRCTKSV